MKKVLFLFHVLNKIFKPLKISLFLSLSDTLSIYIFSLHSSPLYSISFSLILLIFSFLFFPSFLLSPFNTLFHLIILFVQHHCLKQSHVIFKYERWFIDLFLCVHNISSLFWILLKNLSMIYHFIKKSIDDWPSFDINCPHQDDGSLEVKHYSIDFLLH